MRFRAIYAFYMDSEANICKGKIAKSGLAQSNVYKTTTTACKEPSLIRILIQMLVIISADLLNSGRSYLIVYQSYFSQVLNGLP